jgi:hypothetical protein
MTGGILQLVASGVEDLFLTRDPQITFFKLMYRRHTNFSLEDVPQYFVHDPDFGKRATCVIGKDSGDLLHRMCLKITLPEIQKLSTTSSFTTDALDNASSFITGTGTIGDSSDTMSNFVGSSSVKPTLFAWIRKIGFSMIKFIEIEINGKVVDRHYGEWMYLFSQLTTLNINDGGLNKLIGDVPELTEFSETKPEYIMYIPLYFWFCRSSGLALPLVSLQYSDVKINVEFYDLDRCYYVSPTHYIKCNADIVNFKSYEFISQRGSDNVDRYGIFSYYDTINNRLYYTSINSDRLIGVPYDGDISNLNNAIRQTILATPKADKYMIKGVSSDFTVKPDLAVSSITVHRRSLKNIKLKECYVLANFIYLDDDERMKFAQNRHDYLIEQLYYTPNLPIEGSNLKLKLDIDQPCKLKIWVAQLDYINNFNDRFNYTDSHIYRRSHDMYYTDPSKIKMFNSTEINDQIGTSLINETTLNLNSQTRLTKRDATYHEKLQPFQHSSNALPKGVGIYSYSLFPFETYPSGTTNMSQIELIETVLKMNYRVNVNQKAKFRSYALCYNVWRVDNGLSSPVFIR